MIADYDSGEVMVMEPEKCHEWKWIPWNDIPVPRMVSLDNLIRNGLKPF